MNNTTFNREVNNRQYLSHTPMTLMNSVVLAQGQVASILYNQFALRSDDRERKQQAKTLKCEEHQVEDVLKSLLKIRLANLQYAITALTARCGYTLDDMLIVNNRILQDSDNKLGYKKYK